LKWKHGKIFASSVYVINNGYFCSVNIKTIIVMTINAEKYINPFTDFGFKKLFGTEMNKDLLMDFLNELIDCQGEIKEVKYLILK